ncbi:head-tail connector protein [Melissococcus plutonius]|uniref:head-tail connector protein n=1 Tax=Melissococcus plutonius TaxID=33970 RepID=UPI003C2ED1A7
MDDLLTRLKISLRLDDKDEDDLLRGYIAAAQMYVKNAIASNDEDFFKKETVIELYNMAVLSLAGAYYTYRIALVDTVATPINLTLNSIIGQLRGAYAQYKINGDDNGKDVIQQI